MLSGEVNVLCQPVIWSNPVETDIRRNQPSGLFGGFPQPDLIERSSNSRKRRKDMKTAILM